jgi:serine protease AprX
LEEDSDVAYISPDRAVSGMLDLALPAIGADTAQAWGYDGTGIGVAVIDSGITVKNDLRTPALVSRVGYSQNFAADNYTADLYGHGTHVAGIIGGNGSASNCWSCFKSVKGIAPGVNLVNLRALDTNGSGTDSAVIAAIQQAILLKNQYNIRVINLSLGRGIFDGYANDPLCQAVERAWNAGIVVVVAAGNYGRDNSNDNNGYGTITSPGNDPYVITVGAMKTNGTPERTDDLIASYSSKGPTLIDHVVKPDLVAPGNQVVSLLSSTTSTLPVNYPQDRLLLSYYKVGATGYSSSYYRLSGTSMATPMVSAAAALMLQKDPSLTPDQVKARLMKTAYKTFPTTSTAYDSSTGLTYTSQYDIFTVGAGYVDVAAALANTDLVPAAAGGAKSPGARYDPSTGQVYLLTESSLVWGSSLTWDTSIVWGSSVAWGTNLEGQSLVWGSSVCWGNSTSSAFSLIWGSSLTWGSSITWGSSTGSDAMSIAINGED